MKFNLNLQLALYGLVILLGGLIFFALDSVKFGLLIIPFTGVGASILATGLTSWLITRHFTGVDVTSIVQALTESSKFIRVNHTLELIFTLKGDDSVSVSGEHAFTLINQQGRRSRKTFAIYTDLGSWNKCGGFEAVVEPSGNVLHHEALEACITEINGKTYFIKGYDINSKSTASFQFNTFGNYRRIDRLIWTVQDISTDFRVRVVNNTGIRNAFLIKVNHHRERDILDCCTTISKNADDQEVIILDFNCEVLPYQGFEVMWNLDEAMRNCHEQGAKTNIAPQKAIPLIKQGEAK
jgi:hypothetical protein